MLVLQIEETVDRWVEEKVVKHSDSKYVTLVNAPLPDMSAGGSVLLEHVLQQQLYYAPAWDLLCGRLSVLCDAITCPEVQIAIPQQQYTILA